MPEVSEGPQPSPIEQGITPPRQPEAVQMPSVEPSPAETSLNKLEKGDVIGYMDLENKKYLQENAESPEQAEQYIQLYENAKKMKETIAKFSEDDPNIPASEETKQKLIALNNVDNSAEISASRRQFSGGFLALALTGAAAFEFFNLAAGGSIAPPGYATKVGLAIGGGVSGSIEGTALVVKGVEKLKALMGKNKATGTEVTQLPLTETEGAKAA